MVTTIAINAARTTKSINLSAKNINAASVTSTKTVGTQPLEAAPLTAANVLANGGIRFVWVAFIANPTSTAMVGNGA
jgi:hypothetical protein